ncbi:MAG: Cytochrome bo(3) ubiquinol oxidase subunit 3 [Paracidovorax wautersii]|uniref:Cytochrome bo(3) ubiquinol oxidase subunit 3 n=1 Tax=Paracidovorax wautersii TaxID=1177982 RepID=A0A7V8FMW9_9BURK|nr:MAG: Cytochrome bo(3) ubiquinol oxidase subunit 3 [Paracidovorax wautersii]
MSSSTLDHHAAHAAHDAHHDDHHHDHGGNNVFGFWIYLMSDLVLFGSLFATFAVLSGAVADAPLGKELFSLNFVAVETGLLLLSSLSFGFGMLASHEGNVKGLLGWMVVTWLLGAGFVGMELYEFNHLIHEGAGPGVSAYWSAFFLLVGTHGLHVSSGLLWMIVLGIHIYRRGLNPANTTRLASLSLFWHFLDIVWIGVFTIVYLLGAL